MSSSHFNYWQTIIHSNIQTLFCSFTHICVSVPLLYPWFSSLFLLHSSGLLLRTHPPSAVWVFTHFHPFSSSLPLSLSSSHFCLTHSTLVRPSVSLSFPPPCGGLYTLHVSPTTLLPLTMTSSCCCVQSAWWVASCVQQVFSCNFCQENCFTD